MGEEEQKGYGEAFMAMGIVDANQKWIMVLSGNYK